MIGSLLSMHNEMAVEIHHFQAAADSLHVGQAVELFCVWIALGIAVVDPIHLGGLDQHVRIDFTGA